MSADKNMSNQTDDTDQDDNEQFRALAISVGNQIGRTFLATSLHPIRLARIHIQTGYDPSPEVIKPRFNCEICEHLGNIKKVDGWLGLYRGAIPRFLDGFVYNIATYSSYEHLNERHDHRQYEGLEFEPWLKKYIECSTEETFIHVKGLILSHPLHVVMIRSSLQFVGRETKYDTIFSASAEIFNNEGIRGFYAGLFTRIIGEVIKIWLTNFTYKLIYRYVMVDVKDTPHMQKWGHNVDFLTKEFCQILASTICYPFTLATVILTVNDSGLKGSTFVSLDKYPSLGQRLAVLYATKDVKR